MANLDANIRKLNTKQQLWVVRGAPQTLWPKLFKAWSITHLFFEKDDCPYTRKRDEAVTKAAADAGVDVTAKLGHTLYWAEDIIKANKGKAPLAYGAFQKIAETLDEPAQAMDAPKKLPDPGPTDLKGVSESDQGLELYDGLDVNAPSRKADDKGYDHVAGPGGKFAVPTMDEIGMQDATSPHRGGEDKALERLDAFLQNKEYVAKFEKPKSDPSAFEPASTTILSPYLKFGCLSVRLFYHRLRAIEKEAGHHSQPPVSLVGQLLWREMFHSAMFSQDSWNQMKGNSVARFIDWRYANQYEETKGDSQAALTKLPMDQWQLDEQDELGKRLFEAWRVGQTGYPWIDACMRQLKDEGWIHHLARHAVACFLTRGHCYVSWERGQEVFDEFLVDWDPAMNGGNWMWLSCTAFFSQYYRVYSPVAFGKKQDNSAAYVRKFVPEVAGLPDKYLFEPWKAPVETQKKAGCVVGEDYPKPIVAESAKDHVIEKLKAAYAAGLHGADAAVMAGTAQAQLRDALALESPEGADAVAAPPQREAGHKRKGSVGDGVKQSDDDVKRNGKQRKLDFGGDAK